MIIYVVSFADASNGEKTFPEINSENLNSSTYLTPYLIELTRVQMKEKNKHV